MKKIYPFMRFLFAVAFFMFAVSLAEAKTYYSYQSGSWHEATTWTTDPSGLVIDDPGVPANGDAVVIIGGWTVSLTQNVATTGHTITIDQGNLDLSVFSLTPLIALNGSGNLKIGKSYFPTVTTNNFVLASGGTTEYYNFNGTLPNTQLVYKNLLLTNSDAANDYVMTLPNPADPTTYTINGNVRLRSTSNQALTLTLGAENEKIIILNIGNAATNTPGNLRVGPNTTLKISNGTFTPVSASEAKIHQIAINGNLMNNGSIDLTNNNKYQVAMNGAASVAFTGADNNTISGTGSQLDFYKLIVNKGTDQTYLLDVNPDVFSLWAPTQPGNFVGTDATGNYTQENPKINKALWIRRGTLKLGNNIAIPKLVDAEDINNDGKINILSGDRIAGNEISDDDFFVPLAGALWIDGANISVTDIVNPGEIVDAVPGTNANYVTRRTTMTIIGKFRITGGTFNGNKGAGFIYRFTGETLIEGGIINVSQFRISTTASAGITNRSSFVQTAGTFTVRGNNGFTADVNNTFALFSISDPSSTFQMSGGILNINDNAYGGPTAQATPNANGIYINSGPGNYNVTGGIVNIALNGGDNCEIRSVAPFNELNISRFNAAGNAAVTLLAPLTINKNIAVQANSTLNANNSDLIVGGNLTVNAGAQYIPGTNNTILNGIADQSVILNNINPLFYGLTINTQATATFSGTNPVVIVGGTLIISHGSTLNDGGRSFTLNGGAGSGVSNSGIQAGTGKIIMQGSTIQNISGNDGAFNNLTINNALGVALSTNHTVNGELRLANGILDISIYNLTLGNNAKVYDALTGTNINFSNTKMIRTAGNRSDGGLTIGYAFNHTQATFPVGVDTKYTPASIDITGNNANYGSITVRPVNREHPNVSEKNKSLKFYWRVTKSANPGDWNGTITAAHKNYTYNTVTPDERQGTLTAYRAARFDQVSSTWKYNNISYDATNNAVNTFNFNTNTFVPAPAIGSRIEGEFTAGEQAAFDAVNVYYSYQNGDWSVEDSWSTIGFTTLSPPTSAPSSNDIVKIGNGKTITVDEALNPGGAKSGSLIIASGATLDLMTTIGNDFGTLIGEEAVGGTGTLRISSSLPQMTAEFPAGDFGDFIGSNGGTVEYYSTSSDFTLPVSYKNDIATLSLNRYRNLVLNPAAGKTIVMPALNLNIIEDLLVGTTGFTGTAKINEDVNANFTINRNLYVNNALFQLPGNGNNRNIIVIRNIVVGNNGSFSVEDAGALTHTLSIGGNLENNNIFDMYPANSATASSKTAVTFTGDVNTEISGTGSTTDFYKLIVFKGTSQTPVLDVKSSVFTFQSGTAIVDGPSPLVLSTGTFRLSTPAIVTLSANTTAVNNFLIQENARLSVNGGTINIGSSANDNADLILAGRLEVLTGTINIGNAANNNNNDIEYATAASPEINVQGGTLFVNGQVRRSTGSELGTLIYNQSAGQVIINGRNQTANRAKLEIEGGSSTFNMSGGTLTIVRGGGTTYGDLYLHPGFANVSGGTVVLSPGAVAGNQIYKIDAGIPLFNLTMTGAAGNTSTSQLLVSPLVLQNNLEISNNYSVLTTNNLNISVGGNFLNAGTYTPGINTTIFNGIKAQIATFNAATSFYNLTVDKPAVANAADNIITIESTSVTKYNPTVTNTLTLSNGILENGERLITVNGDILNNAIHQSIGAGKIVMTSASTLPRTISGNGTFGRLEIDDVNGVVDQGTITIAKDLILKTGIFDIEDKLLTFGPVAAISANPANSFSAAKMIRSNGVLSDAGVKRMFTDRTNAVFGPSLWPIGAPSGYTPAQINGTATTVGGSITIKLVDARHPATRDITNSELKYFWSVSSTGFSAVTNAQHQYTYLDAMVQGAEIKYVPGRFDVAGFWLYGTTGNMNNGANTIGNATFSTVNFVKPGFPNPNTHYIDGDYTAGIQDNAPGQPKEFGQLPTYYSRNATAGNTVNGVDWSNNTSWSTTGHNGTEVTVGEYPNGAPVIIAAGHKVNAVSGDRYAATLDLGENAILNLGDKTGHNLGQVKGKGKITITATSAGSLKFPAGDYADFVKPNEGTFEFIGNNDATMPDRIYFNNIIFTGTGRKLMAENDIDIKGNWNGTGGATEFPEEGEETVNFSGANQDINSATDIIFNGVSINGGGSKTLHTSISINWALSLGNGYIVSSSDPVNQYLVNVAAEANITGGSVASFVNGPLVHNGIGNKRFPVGKGSIYRPVILNIGAGSSPVLQAELFNVSPISLGGVPDNGIPPIGPERLTNISDIRYWDIKRTSGTVANITGTFAYDAAADVAPDTGKLRISKTFGPIIYNNDVYRSISPVGAGADATSPFAGLQSITSGEFNSFSFFALASTDEVANPLPVSLVYLKANAEGRTVVLDWATASEINNDHFEIERSTDGVNFEYVGSVLGKGTVQQLQKYTFTDTQLPASAVIYYRLNQVDTDGTSEYSDKVSVHIITSKGDAASKWSVYPNPLRGDELEIIALDSNLKPDEICTFRLYHVSGKVLSVQTTTVGKAVTALREILSGTAKGLYLLQIDSSSGREQFKLLKQ